MKTNIEQTALNAIAQYLDCSPDDLSEETYTHYGLTIFSLGSRSYAVGSDSEADDACAEYVKDTLWAFRPSFLAGETELPVECFESLQDKCEDSNDAVLSMVEKTCGIDSLVQSAISADGRGHFLAGYDGEESEQDGFYIYRIN